jgi:hypothetical protein
MGLGVAEFGLVPVVVSGFIMLDLHHQHIMGILDPEEEVGVEEDKLHPENLVPIHLLLVLHEVLTGGNGQIDVEEHTPAGIPSRSPHSAARPETASRASARVWVRQIGGGG